MYLFSFLAVIVGALAFVVLLGAHPEDVFARILRALALAATGFILLWGVLGLWMGLQESRQIDADNAERARLEAYPIPISEVEFVEPTLGPGGRWGAVMEARIRNHSTGRTLYRVSFRWSASYCVVPGSCKSIDRQGGLAFDGVGPGQEYRSREEVAIDFGPQGLNIPRGVSSQRVPVTIQLIEARGR